VFFLLLRPQGGGAFNLEADAGMVRKGKTITAMGQQACNTIN
jgi:hypothetical protein